MAFPKVSDWSERIYNVGVGGFNLLRDFQPEMHRVYPETKNYSFGFYSEDAVPEMSTQGYIHLKGSHFDVEDWNSVVGLRFGLVRDASDNIKHGDNFIMMMPRSYREDVVMVNENAKITELEQASDDAGAFVHPADPEFNKMKDAARDIATTEKYKLQIEGNPDHGEPPKNKGGRPKGSKNKPKTG